MFLSRAIFAVCVKCSWELQRYSVQFFSGFAFKGKAFRHAIFLCKLLMSIMVQYRQLIFFHSYLRLRNDKISWNWLLESWKEFMFLFLGQHILYKSSNKGIIRRIVLEELKTRQIQFGKAINQCCILHQNSDFFNCCPMLRYSHKSEWWSWLKK